MPNRPSRYWIEDLPAPDLPAGNEANESSDDSSSDPSDELSEHSSDELVLASSDNSSSYSNDMFCEGFISLSSEPRSNIDIREQTVSTTVDSDISDRDPQDCFTKKIHNNNENDGRHPLFPEPRPLKSNVDDKSADKIYFAKADKTNPNVQKPKRNKPKTEEIIYIRYRMSKSTPRTTHPEEVQYDRSRVADLSSYQGRLQTFFDWPNHSIDTTKLARAGFYYTGSGDLVRCFLCGCGLHNWKEGDDPWNKHYKAFGKHCQHK